MMRAALILVMLIGAPALAQTITLYKWTDRDGKVQYSDHLPASFKGAFEQVEVDAATNTTQLPGAPGPKGTAVRPGIDDIATVRRIRREQLQANLDRARAKLELARASLSVAGGPDDSERQVIQQRFDQQVAGTSSARANCRAVTQQDGKTTYVCPTVVPNDSYYERISSLEGAVRDAEAEVAAAEEAYRRGVD
jgi:hypothetical protein